MKYIAVKFKPYRVIAHKTFKSFKAAEKWAKIGGNNCTIKSIDTEVTHALLTYDETRNISDSSLAVFKTFSLASERLKILSEHNKLTMIGDLGSETYAFKAYYFAEILEF